MRFKCEPVYKAPGGERLLGEFWVDATDHEAARTQAKAQVWAVLRLTETCLGPSGDDVLQDIHDCVHVAVNEERPRFHEFRAIHEDGSAFARDLGRRFDEMRRAASDLVEGLEKRATAAWDLVDRVPASTGTMATAYALERVRLTAKAQTYDHAAELARAEFGPLPKGS